MTLIKPESYNETGTDSTTFYISGGYWKGNEVAVTGFEECKIIGHALEVMHHYDDKGNHYCPTMYLICPFCGGIADEPEPYECNKWGKK